MGLKIKEIYLDNFKSFKDCRINLGDFNIVIAPNNSGKSNFINALEFINLTFKHGLYKTLNRLGGLENIKNYRSKKDESISIGVKFFKEILKNCSINTVENKIEGVKEIKDYTVEINFSFNEKLHSFKLRIEGQYKLLNKKELEIFNRILNSIDVISIEKILEKKDRKNFYYQINLDFLEREFSVDTDLPVEIVDDLITDFVNLENLKRLKTLFNNKNEGNYNLDITDLLNSNKNKRKINIYTYYFVPKEIKKIKNIKDKDILNKDGINLASVLGKFKREYPKILEKLTISLISVLDEFEGFEINQDTSGNTQLNFIERLTDEKVKSIPLNIVSDGTISLLTILTALYEPIEKTLIAIEEPEKHLHSSTMEYLIEEFKILSKEKQIVITTQNNEILNNIDLKHNNLIFFFRDFEGNVKTI